MKLVILLLLACSHLFAQSKVAYPMYNHCMESYKKSPDKLPRKILVQIDKLKFPNHNYSIMIEITDGKRFANKTYFLKKDGFKAAFVIDNVAEDVCIFEPQNFDNINVKLQYRYKESNLMRGEVALGTSSVNLKYIKPEGTTVPLAHDGETSVKLSGE